jgi:hypothetical protein
MNPPYNKANTFFTKILGLCETCVSLQPTAWLFGKNKKMQIVNQIKDAHCELDIVNPRSFDATFITRVAITYVNKMLQKHVLISNGITNKTITYDDIMDVSELSMDEILTKFNDMVRPLYEEDNMLAHIIHNNGKYHNNNIILIDKNIPIVRIGQLRGHVDQKTGQRQDDFYTLISNNEKEIQTKTINTTRNLSKLKPTGDAYEIHMFILCNNTREQHNIINYMRTDFCRASLMITKFNSQLDRGELKYIPWFDFSDEHFNKTPKEIDDYLFDKYNIDDSIRQHIETILPDYYNIR